MKADGTEPISAIVNGVIGLLQSDSALSSMSILLNHPMVGQSSNVKEEIENEIIDIAGQNNIEIDPSTAQLQLDDFSKWVVLVTLLLLYMESLIPMVGPLLFLVHGSLLSTYIFAIAEYHFLSYIVVYALAV